MNYKTILATLLAAGLVGSQGAQSQPASSGQKDIFFDPDFLLTVPLDLVNIPGELYEAVVWCEIRDRQNKVIAETGGVSISVEGHQACSQPQQAQGQARDRTADSSAPCPGAPGYKAPSPWSVKKVQGTYSPQLLEAANLRARGGPLKLDGVAFDKFHIGDKPPSSVRGAGVAGAEKWEIANPKAKVPSITLRASTPGTVNPASATGYTCHVGFKADVLIDGQAQNISVFGLDAGTLKTIPLDKNAKFEKDIKGNIDTKIQDAKGK